MEFLDDETKANLEHVPGWHGCTQAGPGLRQTIYVDMNSKAKPPDPQVRIVKMPRFRTAVAPSLPAREEELRPGARVRSKHYNGAISYGTVGAFVSIDENIYLLTANHVIAGNGAFRDFRHAGEGIYVGYPEKYVGRTVAYSPIFLGGHKNIADAAFCYVGKTRPASPLYPPEWKLTNGRPFRPRKGDAVKLRSGSGKDVVGKVVEDSAHFHMRLDLPGDLDSAIFGDHILVSGLNGIEKGDSGRLVVGAAPPDGELRPVGLFIGFAREQQSDGYGLVTPLENVLRGAIPNRDYTVDKEGRQVSYRDYMMWDWGEWSEGCVRDWKKMLDLSHILV